MREIRKSGSEGGVRFNPLFLPLSLIERRQSVVATLIEWGGRRLSVVATLIGEMQSWGDTSLGVWI